MFISLFMLGTLLDHYEDRLKKAKRPGEILFLESQLQYYRTRYNNFCH